MPEAGHKMVKTGRRPGWLVAPSVARLPFVEGAWVGARNRLTLPLYGRAAIKWLPEDHVAETLATLREPGRAILRPWDPDGPIIEERIAALAQMPQPHPVHEDELADLRSRYVRQVVEPKGRMTLSSLMLAHLHARDLGSAILFVAFFADRIELWSEQYRSSRLDSADASGVTYPE